MKRTLEVVVWPKFRKGFEFKQTLDCLSGILREHCSSLEVFQSENDEEFTLSAAWENSAQMHEMLQSKEFSILAGAIDALCDRTLVKIDDKPAAANLSLIEKN